MARIGASGIGRPGLVVGTPANGLSLTDLSTLTIGLASTSTAGALSSSDWNTFNNKLDASRSNYISNPDAEVNTAGWNLYNNAGRTNPAFAVINDLTFTSVAIGNAGNGINIDYIFHPSQSYLTPLVTVVSPTHITIAWYNGPAVTNNPTATQLKAAYDAVPAAVALATSAITGVVSNRQYITGAHLLGQGGDTSPIDGAGGAVSGVTFTRTLVNPLAGIASFDLNKDATNCQGQGVSTNFTVNNVDKGNPLQISFAYQGLPNIVLGTSSDVRVFIYDTTNAVLTPVTPLSTLAGPINAIKIFTSQFVASSNSSNYTLILHIATTNASTWDLILDNVVVGNVLNAVAATQVPSVVLQSQPISGSVTDHMCVMWRSSSTQWVPATISGAALAVFGSDKPQLGFATNIVGATADVFIFGYMDGFSFGPFLGYEQFIDNIAGGISPLPSPFTDLWVSVGNAISSTALNIQFSPHIDLISNSSGVPIKGGLLTNSAANDSTGDEVLPPGTNGNTLIANSAASLGLSWLPAVVATTPLVYTVATRSLTLSTIPVSSGGTGLTTTSQRFVFIGPSAGSGAPTFRLLVATDVPTLNQNTTGNAATVTTNANLTGDVTSVGNATTLTNAPVIAKVLTGFVSGAGVVAATDSILAAFNKVVGNIALKSPLVSPVFTGDVNASTGNLLVSTASKGLQVKSGVNSRIGQSTLVTGSVTIANTSVTATSRIFLTVSTAGGTQGFLRTSKVAATSFTITSTSVTETSVVDWVIVESI